jgi:acyl-CoA thioesterase FadM
VSPEPDPRSLRAADFPVLLPMTTRWSDNDVFGHLNNAVYYSLFDSAINRWVGQATGLDPAALASMGVVAESGCRYLGEVSYPQDVRVGLAVARIGTSSVTYRPALFAATTTRRPPWAGGCTCTSTAAAGGRSRCPRCSGRRWTPCGPADGALAPQLPRRGLSR